MNNPAHPDNMVGISDQVYLMQLRKLPTAIIEEVNRKDLAKIVIKERKMQRAISDRQKKAKRLKSEMLLRDLVFNNLKL